MGLEIQRQGKKEAEMGKVAVALLAVILIGSIGPAPARIYAGCHLETGSPLPPAVVWHVGRAGPDEMAPEACRDADDMARGCEFLLLYVGRGSSCPVLCIVLVDVRPASEHECPAQSRWLCRCREVVEGLGDLLGW